MSDLPRSARTLLTKLGPTWESRCLRTPVPTRLTGHECVLITLNSTDHHIVALFVDGKYADGFLYTPCRDCEFNPDPHPGMIPQQIKYRALCARVQE